MYVTTSVETVGVGGGVGFDGGLGLDGGGVDEEPPSVAAGAGSLLPPHPAAKAITQHAARGTNRVTRDRNQSHAAAD
ncbi:MAG TPA: hypothetical protein VGM84_17630 [Steroidobacteraceae bacterium]